MAFSDSFFKKVEKKTNVDKDTIIKLANKLQNGNMKDEKTLKEVIGTLSQMTGRTVSKEQEEKSYHYRKSRKGSSKEGNSK